MSDGIGPDFGAIMDYEMGQLDLEGTLQLFADLIGSGVAWQLQGSYGRQAERFIGAGLINRAGIIDWDAVATMEDV